MGFNLRKRGLSIISHTWKRKTTDKSGNAHLPRILFSGPAYTCGDVYLLVDVDVGWVGWSPCGVPTQKLQLLEYLFNWRRGQSTKHFFKPSFLNLKLLVYFHQLLLSPLESWLGLE